jgi:hypothetical protein
MTDNRVSGAVPAGGMSEGGHILPLANIGLIERAMFMLADRGIGEPGMIAVSGPSGYGKSVAAAWAKARHRAFYVQLNYYTTNKSLLVQLCQVLGLKGEEKKKAADGEVPIGYEYVPPKGTIQQLAERVAAQLHGAKRPLIIDEFDFAIDKNLVMAVFSLYEMSKASFILIGEEAMPAKLKKWEKFDGRMLDPLYAEPVGLEDARRLARAKNASLTLADDLLAHLVKIAKGSVRRVVNNLAEIGRVGAAEGWDTCDLARWGNRPLQHANVKRRDLPKEES